MNEKLLKALNKQINMEWYSGYLYLSMATYFEAQNLSGFASWMDAQAHEEFGHAMKIYGYIHSRLGRVTLKGIDAPKTDWESPLAVFEDAFAHEQAVTASISSIVDLAMDIKDHATRNFLNWFVSEQVEEEESVDKVVQKLKMVKGMPHGLYMLDRELAQRKAH